MLFNLLSYCLRECFQSLWRNIGLTLASSGMVAVSLFLLGSFLLLGINAEQMVRGLESAVEISVFLEKDANPDSVEIELAQMDGMKDYDFISQEEALREMSVELGDEELLDDLEGEENPLPHAFRVQAEDAEMVPGMAMQIGRISGVEKVDYGGELLNWLMKVSNWVNLAFLGVSGLLAAASIYLIVTTIRLSLLIRGEEISIMKYLGASNWFIRFPFLLEGMVIGWVGTLVAVGVLAGGYYYLAGLLHEVNLLILKQPITAPEELLPVWLGLLGAGTLIGGLGSMFSLRRFLKGSGFIFTLIIMLTYCLGL